MQEDTEENAATTSKNATEESDSDNDSDEDDSPEEGDSADGEMLVKRTKRQALHSGYAWCGTNTETVSSSGGPSWPPDPATVGNPEWRNLRSTQPGNPLYGPRMQLYCRTRMHLAIYPDGTVKGTDDAEDLYTGVHLSWAGYPGHVRIQGIHSKLYCCMNRKGWIYGEIDSGEEGTVFIESFQGSYNTYLSRKFAHLGWYIGIKKNGKRKKGAKTEYGQKAIQFLPIRAKFE